MYLLREEDKTSLCRSETNRSIIRFSRFTHLVPAFSGKKISSQTDQQAWIRKRGLTMIYACVASLAPACFNWNLDVSAIRTRVPSINDSLTMTTTRSTAFVNRAHARPRKKAISMTRAPDPVNARARHERADTRTGPILLGCAIRYLFARCPTRPVHPSPLENPRFTIFRLVLPATRSRLMRREREKSALTLREDPLSPSPAFNVLAGPGPAIASILSEHEETHFRDDKSTHE